MFQNVKAFSFSLIFLIVIILINGLIIKTASINNQDFYWALLFSIPLLFFAIYYKRTVLKKETKDKKINFNGVKSQMHENVIIPCRKHDELTVLFGNNYCAQPYLSSIICVESVSANQNIDFMPEQIDFMPEQIILSEDNGHTHDMMQSLNDGLFIRDLIWTIGPDYAGCRDNNFKFNAEAFRVNASSPNVKMIELRLSGFNDKDNISAAGKNFKNNCEYTAFSNAEGLSIFLDSLRQLSAKKPIGIRLRITDKKTFYEICYAFRKTGIIPDYLVIEDYDKENNFLSDPFQNPVMPLYEALLFVSKTLDIYGLNGEIKIIASSEIYSPFDVLRLFALGVDAVSFQNHLIPGAKYYKTDGIKSTAFSRRCKEQLRSEILDSTMNIMQAWGYTNVRDITLPAFFRDLDALYSKGFYKRYDKRLPNNFKSTSFGIVKKSYHEKNTHSEIIFN
jgi:hypothetical protein